MNENLDENNDYPIIFVHGILGWGPSEKGFGNYWGRANDVKRASKHKIEFASVGPISSHWDRARELFYQIKGGTDCIYFCKEYRKHHIHHKPLKTDNQKSLILQDWEKGKKPIYKEWDKKNPIHLVGHSQGAWTILLLQYMLAQGDLFPGYKTDASWIRSVTTISGVLNGSTAPYAAVDFDENTGYYKGTSSPGILNRNILFDFFGLAPWKLLKTLNHARTDPNSDFFNFLCHLIRGFAFGLYNWDLDQWNLTRKTYKEFYKDLKENDLATDSVDTFRFLSSRFYLFIWKASREDFLYGKDNAAYSLSVIGTRELNELFKTYENTSYFSFVTKQNQNQLHFFLKRFGEKIANYPIENLIKTKHWPKNKTTLWPKGAEEDTLWQENDGLVPVISQIYPWLGVKENNVFNVVECDDCNSNIDFWPDNPQKNTWYAMRNVLNRWDHTDIVVFPQKNKGNQYHEQYDFYESLCSNLSKLPK